MRVIRASEQRAMPWKNGGGITYEIASFPDGATLDTFEWRVSMAQVDADGPFSLFPGIDRSLAIVEGDGVNLNVAGIGHLAALYDAPPVTFPADAATSGMLTAGRVLDLNVMTRRAAWSHRLSMRHDGVTAAEAEVRIIVVRDGRLMIDTPGGAIELSHRDAAIFADGPVSLRPAGSTTTVFFQIDLWREKASRMAATS